MFIPTQKLGKTKNGNSLQTHCQNGHPFDEINTYISPKSQKRSCRICGSIRKTTQYLEDLDNNRQKAKEHMRSWRAANRERNRRNWTETRKLKKIWVITQKVACIKCGESDPDCLDFHHRDPKQKITEISLAIARWSIKRIQEEINKCDLLCANCHRKLEAAKRQERNL